MENYDKILDLLKEKLEVFLYIEKLTNMMFSSDIDELTSILTQRGELLQKAVLIESEIDKEASGKEHVNSILKNSGDMSNIADDLARIYEASMRVKAVINRINNLDADVRERLESERGLILKKIESLYSNSNSVAGNYKRSVQMGFPQISLLDKEKSI